MQYAGQSNLKRVSLECGGKSPNIVLADYDDLDKAAAAAAAARFSSTRARCARRARGCWFRKASRIALLEKVAGLARAMQPGDPLDPATRLGAMVDEVQMKRVLGYIEAGRQ